MIVQTKQIKIKIMAYEIIDELSICSDYLFVKIKGRNVGEAMNYSDIYSLFKRLKHKTFINVHPHLFRHTHATVFYNEKLRI